MSRILSSGLALAVLLTPLPTAAQEVAEQIREHMKSEVFNVGVLLRTTGELRLENDFSPSRVDVTTARLRVGGELGGGFRYFGQFDFTNEPALLDVRLGWSPGPEFLVRAGRFKAPFSRELLTSFGARDFHTPARVVRNLAPNRQYGVELSGRPGDHLRWSVGGFTGSTVAENNERGLVAGRVVFDRLFASESGSGLSVGVNGAFGTDEAIAERLFGSSFRGDATLVGVDARYERGPGILSAEWIHGEFDSERIVPDLLPGARPPVETDARGVLVTGGWHFTDAVQGLVRWDHYEAPEGEGDDLLLFGVNVTPTDFVRLMAVYRAPLEDASEPHRIFAFLQLFF